MYTLYILYLNTLGMRHKQGDQKLFRKLKNDRFKRDDRSLGLGCNPLSKVLLLCNDIYSLRLV